MMEKTTVYTASCSSGLMNVHKKPSTETLVSSP